MHFLSKLSARIDAVNESVGRGVAWLALLMVLVQFVVVILRYVFSIGFIPMQESIWYLHGMLFMIGAGYTLLHGGHVRVDIFYREASPRRRAVVDIVGIVVFLFPICIATWWLSWSYVINSWRVLEGSTEVSGLPLIFLLKSVLLVFVALLFLQAISMLCKAVLTLSGHSAQDDVTHAEGI